MPALSPSSSRICPEERRRERRYGGASRFQLTTESCGAAAGTAALAVHAVSVESLVACGSADAIANGVLTQGRDRTGRRPVRSANRYVICETRAESEYSILYLIQYVPYNVHIQIA